ncbi:MAG: phosphonate C-P lyase system protein PhnH [Pseudorhodoplanes sp.]
MASVGLNASVLSAQATFRAILQAVARPGTIQPITPPAPSLPQALTASMAAIALTLCDQDTPVWLADSFRVDNTIPDWLRFHCGCRISIEPRDAAFGFAQAAAFPGLDSFNAGTPDYPDRSATLILQVESLTGGTALVLRGPGIQDQHLLQVTPLPVDLLPQLEANRALFPRGVDVLLAAPNAVAALPRTTFVTKER